MSDIDDPFEDPASPTDDGSGAGTRTVELHAQDGRLDRALAKAVPDLSRARLQTLINQGSVIGEDGTPLTRPSLKLQGPLTVSIEMPELEPAAPKPQDIPLDIVFEDEALLVVNKPVGLVVHPGAGNPDGTLVNAVLHHCRGRLSGIGGVARPGIVHRLDRETSGLMVVAKNDAAHHGLADQFADRDGRGEGLSRVYRAVVHGRPMPAQGLIEAPIARHPKDRLRMAVRESGKPSATRYKIVELLGHKFAAIDCTLLTGRTHQIRVHMGHIGHPLVGDPLYGKRGGPSFPRQALHAWKLSFDHPVTGNPLSFEAPMPDDLERLFITLNREG